MFGYFVTYYAGFKTPAVSFIVLIGVVYVICYIHAINVGGCF